MSHVPAAVRALVLARDGEMCVRCPAAKPASDVHHRRPRAMGSSEREHTNCACNLICLCRACHDYVERHRNEAKALGLLVAQHEPTPGEVSLFSKGRVWALRCDGSREQKKER